MFARAGGSKEGVSRRDRGEEEEEDGDRGGAEENAAAHRTSLTLSQFCVLVLLFPLSLRHNPGHHTHLCMAFLAVFRCERAREGEESFGFADGSSMQSTQCTRWQF